MLGGNSDLLGQVMLLWSTDHCILWGWFGRLFGVKCMVLRYIVWPSWGMQFVVTKLPDVWHTDCQYFMYQWMAKPTDVLICSMHTQITSYCTVHKKKHTANSFAHTYLWCTIYHPCSYTTLEDLLHRKTDESTVFTNSELSLKHVDVYGFDFDYTLVHYTTEVNKLIYELARDRLVEKLNVCLQLSLFILCALC